MHEHIGTILKDLVSRAYGHDTGEAERLHGVIDEHTDTAPKATPLHGDEPTGD